MIVDEYEEVLEVPDFALEERPRDVGVGLMRNAESESFEAAMRFARSRLPEDPAASAKALRLPREVISDSIVL